MLVADAVDFRTPGRGAVVEWERRDAGENGVAGELMRRLGVSGTSMHEVVKSGA